jgi:hypothetical protein
MTSMCITFPGASLNFGPSGKCGIPGVAMADMTSPIQRIANVLIDISEALVAAAQRI